MSQGELSLENSVVVTRGTGRYYISKQRADNLLNLINSDSCPRMIDINDNYVAASDIVGIVSAVQIENLEKTKRGLWQCGKGAWHNRDEVCKCGWGMNKPSELETEEERTPAQIERAEIIAAMREKGMHLREMIKLKGKTNEELKQMLSDM